jgi:hypothetical protein
MFLSQLKKSEIKFSTSIICCFQSFIGQIGAEAEIYSTKKNVSQNQNMNIDRKQKARITMRALKI